MKKSIPRINVGKFLKYSLFGEVFWSYQPSSKPRHAFYFIYLFFIMISFFYLRTSKAQQTQKIKRIEYRKHALNFNFREKERRTGTPSAFRLIGDDSKQIGNLNLAVF